MALSDIGLCSAALLGLGANQISAFTEGTVEAEVSARLYPIARDALLSEFYWSFARRSADLNKLTVEPESGYAWAYQLPNDCLRVERLGDWRVGGAYAYELSGRELHTDADPVTVTYTARLNSASWPPYFDTALIARLRAMLCMPITENAQVAALEEQKAVAAVQTARLADSQQATPRRFRHFPLIAVRG